MHLMVQLVRVLSLPAISFVILIYLLPILFPPPKEETRWGGSRNTWFLVV